MFFSILIWNLEVCIGSVGYYPHSFVNLKQITTPLQLKDKFVIQPECFSHWRDFLTCLSN